MTTIWKFPLNLQDEQKIKVPTAFIPLSVDWQFGNITLWAMVWPDDLMNEGALDYRQSTFTERTVYIVGTGNPMPEGLSSSDFVGTVKMAADQLVWHVFVGR